MDREALAEVMQKSRELIAAPTCSSETKAAAQRWLSMVGTDREREETEKYFAELERVAPDFMYMPIVSDTDTVSEKLLKRKITLAGAEVLFDSEEKAVAGKEYLDFMHENGLAVWVNPIVYDYRAVISAHHTDDVAIAGDPDTGWGWLAERGFDILQTDWLTPADVYLTRKGYRHA